MQYYFLIVIFFIGARGGGGSDFELQGGGRPYTFLQRRPCVDVRNNGEQVKNETHK